MPIATAISSASQAVVEQPVDRPLQDLVAGGAAQNRARAALIAEYGDRDDRDPPPRQDRGEAAALQGLRQRPLAGGDRLQPRPGLARSHQAAPAVEVPGDKPGAARARHQVAGVGSGVAEAVGESSRPADCELRRAIGKDALGRVADEQVDADGGDQAHERECRAEPEPHPDRPCHECFLTDAPARACRLGQAQADLRGRIGTVRTLVFIPAWNEEASIGEVIASVRAALPDADVLVVDDGSIDATAGRARGRRRPGRLAALQPGPRRGPADRLPLRSARGL